MEANNSAELEFTKKLTAALDAVKPVGKKGTNKFQNYKYRKAEDVAEAFRHELFSRGLVLIPDEESPEYSDVLTKDGGTMTECRLKVHYKIKDGGYTEVIDRHGVARDNGDKALAKAQTAAEKSFLTHFGLLPVAQMDPEADTSVDRAFAEREELPEPPAPRDLPPARPRGRPPAKPPAPQESSFGRLFHAKAGAETPTHPKKTDAEQRAYIKTLTGGSESANDIPVQKRNEAMKWASQSGVPLPTETSF